MNILPAAIMALAVLIPSFAMAQEEVSPAPDAPVELSAEIQGELLPGDGFAFGLETAWFRIKRAFTFQAERKAELDVQRFEKLEIKITACSELGDEECVAKLEQLITITQERAERHLERKAQVLEKHRERFEELKTRHEDRRQELQEKLQERRARLEELQAERQERFDEFREMRINRLEELREAHQERRQEAVERQVDRQEQQELRQEQREQNRDQIIELRSGAVKNRLDATRDRVEDYQGEYNNVAR